MWDHFYIRNLARAFLAGPWSADGLIERGTEAMDKCEPWLRRLVRRIVAIDPPPDEEQLAHFLRQYFQRTGHSPVCGQPHRLFWVTPQMAPAEGIAVGDLPVLRTSAEVAGWLGLTLAQLDWFAAPVWRARSSSEAANHYGYRWLAKRSGPSRLIEAPKPRLKAIQRRILHDLLDKVPSHEAAHGYRRGRSVLTYAAPHARRRIVLRFDLRDFFPSIPASRVHALFRRLGYPKEVARILTRLCTNATPAVV